MVLYHSSLADVLWVPHENTILCVKFRVKKSEQRTEKMCPLHCKSYYGYKKTSLGVSNMVPMRRLSLCMNHIVQVYSIMWNRISRGWYIWLWRHALHVTSLTGIWNLFFCLNWKHLYCKWVHGNEHGMIGESLVHLHVILVMLCILQSVWMLPL